MMENIGIMFVFFILIALGFIFYARIGGHSAVQEQEKFYQQRAVKLAQLVSSLPEVRCSEDNVPVADCFDILRVDAMRETLNTDEAKRYYLDILSFSTVKVNEIYPSGNEVILYDRKPVKIDSECNQQTGFGRENVCLSKPGCLWDENNNVCYEPLWTSLIPIQIPITLYNASADYYSFGILEVGIYEK